VAASGAAAGAAAGTPRSGAAAGAPGFGAAAGPAPDVPASLGDAGASSLACVMPSVDTPDDENGSAPQERARSVSTPALCLLGHLQVFQAAVPRGLDKLRGVLKREAKVQAAPPPAVQHPFCPQGCTSHTEPH